LLGEIERLDEAPRGLHGAAGVALQVAEIGEDQDGELVLPEPAAYLERLLVDRSGRLLPEPEGAERHGEASEARGELALGVGTGLAQGRDSVFAELLRRWELPSAARDAGEVGERDA